jgi:hypothetical protein
MHQQAWHPPLHHQADGDHDAGERLDDEGRRWDVDVPACLIENPAIVVYFMENPPQSSSSIIRG